MIKQESPGNVQTDPPLQMPMLLIFSHIYGHLDGSIVTEDGLKEHVCSGAVIPPKLLFALILFSKFCGTKSLFQSCPNKYLFLKKIRH